MEPKPGCFERPTKTKDIWAPGRTCDFAARAAAAQFPHYIFVLELLSFSQSHGNALRALLLYLELAILQAELWECFLRATFVLRSCEFRAEVARARFACYCCNANAIRVRLLHLKLASFQPELRNALAVLLLYLEVVNFDPELQECASHTAFVRKKCDCAAGAAGGHFVYYLYSEVSILQLELRECSSYTVVLNTIFNLLNALRVLLVYLKLTAGAAGTHFAYYFASPQFPFSSPRCRRTFPYYTLGT